MIRKRTLQSTLFRSFSTLFILVMSLLIGFFFLYTRNVLLRHSTDAIEDLAQVLSAGQDEEIRKLDVVSINTAYSELVTGAFQAYLESSEETVQQRRRALAETLTAIVGPQIPVKQIYLYGLNSNRLGVGMLNMVDRTRATEASWYEAVIAAGGHKVIAGPVIDPTLADSYVNQQDRRNILLVRLFFDRFGSPIGIMELVQDASKIFLSATNYESTRDGNVYVFGNDGSVIYPSSSASQVPNELYIRSHAPGSAQGSFVYRSRTGSHLAAYVTSSYTGWTTVISHNRRALSGEISTFTLLTIAVIAPAFLAVFAMSYLVSRSITRPLRIIHKTIESMELSSASDHPESVQIHLNELEELNQAVEAMRKKLRVSLEETLAAHRHESEARMQALQSQVNPHFLHNTISTMSVMAEERMYDDIVRMCGNLSSMMRYLADQAGSVNLTNELDYTRTYLDIMKLRYREQLSYEILQPPPHRTVQIPRLVVQPIVENAIKHGTRKKGPWFITVSTKYANDMWHITVRDNGPGIPGEILTRWRTSEPATEEIPLESGHRGGIGVVNIARRLCLWYGEGNYVFSACNRPEGGAEVVIGGRITHG